MIETEKDMDKSRSFDSDIAFIPCFFSDVCRSAASDVFAYGKSDVAPGGRSDVMCSFSRAKRTSLGEAIHNARSAHHVPQYGTHHSKKPNLSDRQIRLLCWCGQ